MVQGAQNSLDHVLIGLVADDGDRPWSNRLVMSGRSFHAGRHGHSSVQANPSRNRDAE
jgi:hypothetical protein